MKMAGIAKTDWCHTSKCPQRRGSLKKTEDIEAVLEKLLNHLVHWGKHSEDELLVRTNSGVFDALNGSRRSGPASEANETYGQK
ncbi:hypothetical protein KIN20_009998 [Parelaphostrongylus tenuis]|uniref:Uncharacterized protein n=1 Tax=Parelaphostrongylus tenuis TaxID=148309 RepID=A0AAD5M789_PARTN|nr:hypothetical protein KIN20_009998 [Parelaphostrongylus tenuis]